MKITALEINNIASIDGCYQIDFESEPLNSIGLFAITGATGAGKSTILDAICLALYNKTPRLAPLTSTVQIFDTKDKTISNKDVKTLLRKGAIQGHVKLTFIGVDGKYYRSEWNIRRANNRLTGAIQNEIILLHNITDDVAFPENRKTLVLAEIERLVGLKYEQFTKSVILAQGEFTSFLKADDNNRADILEKLTGTDIYSKISRKVFEKYRFNKSEVDVLNTKLEMFQLFTDEEIEALNNEITYLETRIKDLSSDLINSKNIQNWYKTEKEILQEILIAQNVLTEKREKLISESSRINRFKDIEKFQEIKDVVVAFEKNKEDKKNHFKLLENNTQTTKIQSDKLNNLNNELNIFREQFNNKKIEFEKNIPLYKDARNLDLRIEIEHKNLIEKESKKSELENNWIKINSELSSKKINENEINQHKNQIKQWFEQNRIYETFVSNENLVLAYLNDIQENNQGIPEEEQKIQQFVAKRNSFSPILEAKIAQEIKKTSLEIELTKSISELDSILKNKNLPELENSLKELNSIQNSKKNDLENLQNIIQQKGHLDKIESKITDFEQKSIEIKSDLSKNELQKNEATIQKNTLQNVLNRMLLEKSKDVIELRANLINDEACPVCGSLEHPYAKHNPLDKITDETKIEFENLEKKLQDLTTKYASLSQQLIQITTNISDYKEEKNKIQIEIDKLNFTVKSISNYEFNLNETENFGLISEALRTISENINSFETELGYLKRHWFQREEFQQKLYFLHQEKVKLNQEINEFKQEISDLNYKLESVSKQIQTKKENYNRLIEEVSRVLDNNLWLDFWQKNQNEFIRFHKQIAIDWRKQQSNLENLSEQSIKNRTEIQEIEKALHLKNEEVQKTKIELFNLQSDFEKIKSKRLQFFNGESIDFVENKLNSEIQNLNQTIESKNLEKLEINNKIIELNSQKNGFEDYLKKLDSTINQYQTEINNWTETNEISLENVFVYLQFNSEWIQNERNYIQQIHTEIDKQLALFEDKKHTLEKHSKNNKPEISEEEIILKTNEIEIQINELKEKALSNKHHLQTDSDQRKTQSSLIEKRIQLGNIATKWNQLNDLIGSADGAKFKKIAQEYTLDILLRYANIHLEKINRRYILERIPNTLSLQVIDNDMACEIRSVHSLSGGESFLVSLALALALSSLSSSKMNIESLFIDEGFGTLDAQTLAIAMDALESLQNQGKKVGVISHVSEMTERIPVQIHVEKHGNGRSSIEIISF